jgi:membrane associated rhomboid family serine protease
MIPLRDVIPSRSTPVVTMTIIGVNVMVFLLQLSLGEAEGQAFIQAHGLIPAYFAWPNVVTSMFLHGGLMHVGGNMLYLWIFGDNVEDRMGHGRFLGFYLLCGAAAALAQTVAIPDSIVPMVGASGAIAGIMGAYFVLYPHSRVLTLIPLIIFWEIIEVPAILLLGFWFLMQLFNAGAIAVTANTHGSGGVAFMAHVAGFVCGVIGVFAFRRGRQPENRWV